MNAPKRPPRSLVLQIVAEEAVYCGVRPSHIFAEDRRRAVSFARWRVCQRLRAMNYGLSGIGIALGLDHSSVHFALKKDVSGPVPKLSYRLKCGKAKTPWPRVTRLIQIQLEA